VGTLSEELLRDLPRTLPAFVRRFGTDGKCRAYLVRALRPEGFRCAGCDHAEAWSHKKRLIEGLAGPSRYGARPGSACARGVRRLIGRRNRGDG